MDEVPFAINPIFQIEEVKKLIFIVFLAILKYHFNTNKENSKNNKKSKRKSKSNDDQEIEQLLTYDFSRALSLLDSKVRAF